MSPSTSLLLLGHGCPLPAARVVCPTALPWPLAMAQLQVAHHHKSSLPRMVQPLPASVSPPGSDLLYKHQLRAGDTRPLRHHHVPRHGSHYVPPPPRARWGRGHWEKLLWPGHASLPGPGPTPAPGLMMDKPPLESHRRGALEKQAEPGTRPAGMDGTKLGAHACDYPPVCEYTCAHGWMFLHADAFPCRVTHTRMHLRAQMIMHTHDRANTFVFGHTHAHSHTRVHMHGHTRPSSPAGPAPTVSSPAGDTEGQCSPQTPQPHATCRASVSPFGTTQHPNCPRTCGPWCGTEQVGQVGALPGPGAGTATTSQNHPPAIASRFGSQMPQLSLSPSQTGHHQAGSRHGEKHHPPVFS